MNKSDGRDKKIPLQANYIEVYFNVRNSDLMVPVAFDFLILFALGPELPNADLTDSNASM